MPVDYPTRRQVYLGRTRLLAIFIFWLIILGLATWASKPAWPQDKPAPTPAAPVATKVYTPSPDHQKDITIVYQQAQIANMQLSQAQQQFQSALERLQAEGDKVIAAEGWPKGTTFDPQTQTFKGPVTAAAATEKKDSK